MKKTVCLFVILSMLILSSCSVFDIPTDGGEKGNDNTGNITAGEGNGSEDDFEPDTDGTNPDEEDTTNPDDGNDDLGNGDDQSTDTPQAQPDSISDYILGLIGSEYCNDPEFLKVAAAPTPEAKNIIYVSNDGEGEGDFDDPMSLEDALDSARAGDTVYLRGGEYIFTETIWISLKGKADGYIVIKSYPGEKAVLTTTPENVNKYHENGEYIFFGIDAGSCYLIFEDLEIHGATDEYVGAFACFDGGQHHLIFKNIEIHDLNTTYTEGGCNAFLFMGEKKNSINNIMLLNNRCYDLTLGYSEAISFAGNCEYCYVIGNEVYDNTNIGIDFYGNAGYCSTESLDQARYCVAACNTVYNCNSPYADCAGIYVDGGRNCLIEANLVYGSQYGIEIGSEEKNDKYPVTEIIVRNNILKNNTVCAMRIGGYDKKSSGVVKNCQIINNSFVDTLGDFDIILSMVDNLIIVNNLFIGGEGIVETEFAQNYISNLSFYSNAFDEGAELEMFGKELSIAEFNLQYGSDNVFVTVQLDSNNAPVNKLVGNAEYMPKYDFNLFKRENGYIGAIE